MTKSTLMNNIKQVKARVELEGAFELLPLEYLDLILDYINDVDIRTAIDEALM